MNAVLHPLLTIEDYLVAERASTVRHEYAGSQVFAMAGAGKRHNRITQVRHLTPKNSPLKPGADSRQIRL